MSLLLILFFFKYSLQSNLTYQPPENFCSSDAAKACEILYAHKHLYCGDKPDLRNSNLGTNPERVELSDSIINLFLDSFNEIRNIVACGSPKMINLAGDSFPKALQMPKLVWSRELEWTSDLSAKTCTSHSYCPITENFPNSGQIGTDFPYSNFTRAVSNFARDYLAEYLNMPLASVDSFSEKLIFNNIDKTSHEYKQILNSSFKYVNLDILYNSHAIPIFILDKNSRFGCSVYKCGSKDKINMTISIVCSFERNEVEGQPLYEKHDIPGSGCLRKSTKFCCLCLQDDDLEIEHDNQTCFESKMHFPFQTKDWHQRSISCLMLSNNFLLALSFIPLIKC